VKEGKKRQRTVRNIRREKLHVGQSERLINPVLSALRLTTSEKVVRAGGGKISSGDSSSDDFR
jgi:hypothetical protein